MIARGHSREVPKHEATTNKPSEGYYGQLKKPLDEYSSADLMALVAGKGWHGWERNRECTDNDSDCQNHQPSGRMLIQGIGDANNVPASSVHYGVVIGRMQNVGAYEDRVFHIKGGQLYPSLYFFIIVPTRPASDKSSLYIKEVSFNQENGSMNPKMADLGPARVFYACSGHKPGDFPHGDFRSCGMAQVKNDVNGSESRSHDGASSRATADAFAWFSCAAGCCTGQYPPLL